MDNTENSARNPPRYAGAHQTKQAFQNNQYEVPWENSNQESSFQLQESWEKASKLYYEAKMKRELETFRGIEKERFDSKINSKSKSETIAIYTNITLVS
jgi:hypothetical protein